MHKTVEPHHVSICEYIHQDQIVRAELMQKLVSANFHASPKEDLLMTVKTNTDQQIEHIQGLLLSTNERKREIL